MKFCKYLMLLMLGLTSTHAFGQQETAFENRENNRDDTAVREFVESKENIDVREKASNLEISGDVRFVWQNKHERGRVLIFDESSSYEEISSIDRPNIHEEVRSLRGNRYVGRDELPISCNDFNVKFNLKVKYDFDKTWAMGHLQFNNQAGITATPECRGELPIFDSSGSRVVKREPLDRRFVGHGSGVGGGINLKRAYIGHNLYADGKHRLDLQIGRRQLDDIFMSEIQFDNYFDGVLFEYAGEIDKVSDWYLKAGVFVVDQRVDHFGWATEIGFLHLFDTLWDVRYSFIDWRKDGFTRCFVNDPEGTRFQISQFTLGYQITPKIFKYDVPVELYGAFLINTAAHKNKFTRGKLANLGWYFDLYAGNVVKKGDWSFEFIYAVVQAQAVPDFDVAGVTRGNILANRVNDVAFANSSSSESGLNGYFVSQGNANYQGCLFDFLYAVTDNFSIDLSYEFSTAVDKHIGGPHNYHNLEFEFLYAF
ncbi:MAG: hypothetical protein ACHQUC_05545 [Chlamydiales bacterium]